jgi:5-(carboxyamino)imidazole ribonucleotide synthase
VVQVYPPRRALEVAQDRLTEKQFLQGLGLRTAPFAAVASTTTDALQAAATATGLPAILKTRRFGYDGKGQTRIEGQAELASAVTALGAVPTILEGMVPLAAELSVIAVRGRDGSIASYDIPRNVHRDGILHTSTVPGGFSPDTEVAARDITNRILVALDYVGVLGVELFLTADGRLLVNEIAPRVHNSGHWTVDACGISQFENHIRAVAGWPLGSTDRHSDAVMTNLIGADADGWLAHAKAPGTALHLYGKGQARPGRKMGHLTQISPLCP